MNKRICEPKGERSRNPTGFRVFLIVALMGIFLISFLPLVNFQRASAFGTLVQSTYSSCVTGGCGGANPPQTLSVAYIFSVTAGNALIVSGEITCENCGTSGFVVTSITDSQGNNYTLINHTHFTHTPGLAAGSDQADSAVFETIASSNGADTVTMHIPTGDSGNALYVQLYEVAGITPLSASTSGGAGFNGSTPQHLSVSPVTLGGFTIGAIATDSTGACGSYVLPSAFVRVGACNAGTAQQGIGEYNANQSGSGFTLPVSYSTGEGIWSYTVIAFNAGGGGGGCLPTGIYYCTTIVYSTTVINSWCQTNPSVCTNETSTVTWSYDATSTTIIVTTCSTTGNGSQYCVTQTKSYSATQTLTSTGVSLVIISTTTTTTATAVIAPTTNSLLYWFFGFVSLLIPPATLVGIRANQSGSTSGEDFIPLILIGLFVGSLLGLILNVLPWEFLVAFGGILVLYVIRSRL